jgi:hypothetical protein
MSSDQVWSEKTRQTVLEGSLLITGVYAHDPVCGNRTASVQKNLLRMSKHVRNLQQATLFSFYLFGFVLFAAFQSAYRVLENSSTPVGLIVVRNFQIHFVFAAKAFLVFLVFQFIQWFTAKRVSAMGLQSNS